MWLEPVYGLFSVIWDEHRRYETSVAVGDSRQKLREVYLEFAQDMAVMWGKSALTFFQVVGHQHVMFAHVMPLLRLRLPGVFLLLDHILMLILFLVFLQIVR
jgi:hypothetical protein